MNFRYSRYTYEVDLYTPVLHGVLMMKRTHPADLASGSVVWIPADVRPGMFPDERFVRFVTDGTTVCGFVPARTTRGEEGHGQVRGVVLGKGTPERVRLLISGEILTTTNPVLVPKRWLAEISGVSSG